MSVEAEKPKAKSWADIPIENNVAPEVLAESNKAEEMANESFQVAVVKVLRLMLQEMRLQRAAYLAANGVSAEVEIEDITDDEKDDPATAPRPATSAIPENFKNDKEIEEFYKKTLEKVLSPEELKKTEVSIAEDIVALRTPWVGDKFKDLSALLRTMGGEWVRDGKQSHWKMPKPATS